MTEDVMMSVLRFRFARKFGKLCCAEGAVSFLAWGIAPGFVVPKNTSAESAIQFLGEFDT
jgi:hypothetical protein